ncbi:oxidoreductase [Leptospira perolatii]|uniref:Oxidoreductase n=1 Tax=Leptospira perolatii TaxID=2023191 RepID=A0A2M9ZJP3_9LEPT|nr:DsbA family protein [Leptospira perolatii]PJZ68586.1 oxidoreductase [Leptospira perolatii]PJZ72241.1 oxidoreductase [Leptospira perolatii]
MSEESTSKWMKPFSSFNTSTYSILGILIAYIGITAYPLFKFFYPEYNLTVGYRVYTFGDVAKEKPEVYRKYIIEANNLAYRMFSQFASSKILDIEAKERGIEVKDLTKFAQGYEPSEQEKMDTYNQYKATVPDLKGKSYGQVQEKIAMYLKRMKEDEEKQSFYQQLRGKYEVNIHVPEPPPAERLNITTKGNPSLGPEDAKVTIVEFSDFECPYCKRSQEVTKILREKYQGKIRWVFRDFPLSFHQNAMYAHMAANCAIPQGKYWEFFQVLFQNSGNLEKSKVISLAQSSGLNVGQLQSCIADSKGSVKSEIEQDMADGQEYGVNGTPAFFINGLVVEGAQPIESFTKIIDEELKN